MNDSGSSLLQRILARLRPGRAGGTVRGIHPGASDEMGSVLPPLSAEQSSQLEQLVVQANTAMENAASEASSRAFNLGCLTGLLPAAILLLSMAMSIGWSLIGVAMALALTVITMVAFANLAAAVARANTMRRT